MIDRKLLAQFPGVFIGRPLPQRIACGRAKRKIPAKRRIRTLSSEEMALEDYEKKLEEGRMLYPKLGSMQAVSRHIGISYSTVRRWFKRSDRLNSGNPNYRPYRVNESK